MDSNFIGGTLIAPDSPHNILMGTRPRTKAPKVICNLCYVVTAVAVLASGEEFVWNVPCAGQVLYLCRS
jgi:hypothetical protein